MNAVCQDVPYENRKPHNQKTAPEHTAQRRVSILLKWRRQVQHDTMTVERVKDMCFNPLKMEETGPTMSILDQDTGKNASYEFQSS